VLCVQQRLPPRGACRGSALASLSHSQAFCAELLKALSPGPHLRRRHQTGCGNKLHSFCQSSTIKPPSVCSLQTGMADQLWHKQNSRLGVNLGTDYAFAGCDCGAGVEYSQGLPFFWLELQGPLESAWIPINCQSLGDCSPTLESNN
jgi:hypothetical protein